MIHLEFLRRAQGLSQTELGERILYSRSLISRLEKEKLSLAEMHPRAKDALERYFSQPIEYLLSTVDPEAGK